MNWEDMTDAERPLFDGWACCGKRAHCVTSWLAPRLARKLKYLNGR